MNTIKNKWHLKENPSYFAKCFFIISIILINYFTSLDFQLQILQDSWREKQILDKLFLHLCRFDLIFI